MRRYTIAINIGVALIVIGALVSGAGAAVQHRWWVLAVDVLLLVAAGQIAFAGYALDHARRRIISLTQTIELERTMAEASREQIIMPVFIVDADWRITGIEFPPIRVEHDRSLSFLMPVVRGLGVRTFMIHATDRDGSKIEREATVDFDRGGFTLVDVD